LSLTPNTYSRHWLTLLFAFCALGVSYAQEGDSLRFPIQKSYDPLMKDDSRKLFGEDPSNVETEIQYDPESGNYEYRQKMGDLDYSNPSYMSFDEYQDYQLDKSMGEYWKQIREEAADSEEDGSERGSSGFRPSINVNSEKFDRIFGGNTITIRPNLSAELIFGINSSKTENPQIPVNQQRITTFDFRQNIQLNAIGNIGDKLRIQFNYNTQATFNFENQMKLEYTGYEDEIIQKIELGNVSLPLQSSLITGSQALFGVKTQLKFGRLTVTSVYSQQQSERKEVSTEGGAQEVEFQVGADEYEMNRHYFLSHFFRDQYERALSTPPIINSSVNITRVEVWVTNTNFSTDETRNIVALQDLAESQRVYNPQFSQTSTNARALPASNGANAVYRQLYQDPRIRGFIQSSQRLESQYGLNARFDYQKIELARKLQPDRDYVLHPQLGYISLVQELQPNQVMAVAFEYTYNGRSYKVGEFSNETTGSEALILKMLKSTELNTRFPMWDLMMKNVYAIGAYQLQPAGFEIGIWYLDRTKGIDINYLPTSANNLDEKPLLQVVQLDRINNNNAIVPDGIFDFLSNPQITVSPSNGRIFFPVLEPFGSHLRSEIGDETIAAQYAFDSLYTNTRANAQYNFPNLNRFSIKGRYQSANSSEISLNAFNIPEGSVTVTAGGAQLRENQDYTVDYNLGRVTIINQGILESGIPVKVSLESNAAFGINRKALFASRFDYEVSDNLNLGGTIMNLSERPLTQKINFGDEPINNTVLGIDGTYTTESQFLTSLVDKIPLINTKEISNITVQAEAARLFPGHSRAIGKEGNSFIDDFEGSQSTIDLRAFSTWFIASTPQGQPDLFPEANISGEDTLLRFNKNRARLAWYLIDPLFYRNDNTTPDHISGNEDIQEHHLMRAVFESEVFPNREFSNQTSANNFQISMFDMAFYPEEPGPYNFDVNIDGNLSRGLTDEGLLAAPETRWGGIMRRIDQNDFDAANIEFIQFWMMDPYSEAYRQNGDQSAPGAPGFETNGELYFNIGNISEDILKDEFKAFENGFPSTQAAAEDLSGDTLSPWGRVPEGQQIVNAFDNNTETRSFQDVGLDGLRDEEERLFYNAQYIDALEARTTMDAGARDALIDDPSHDNYNFYRDDDYDAAQLDILERYKFYNGLEGNSPTSDLYPSQNAGGYPTSGSTIPDAEDINRDNTLDNVESYFQYRVDISEGALSQEGTNYINDIYEPEDGDGVRWIQFRIPIREFEKRIGGIQDFRSIRFMRMFMRGFENPVVLRFARLELVRGEWRRFLGDLDQEGEGVLDDPDVLFNIGAVNIEENASKEPVNYVLPPQLQREIQAGAPNLARQNEQSLALQVCGLEDGKAQGAFRNVTLDMRSFKKLQMFLHAEQLDPNFPLDDDDIKVFIRIGTDFTDNYYEYETPVTITPQGRYSNESASDQEIVWPLENNVIISFEDLFRAKRERNERLGGEEGITLRQRYEVPAEAGRKIFVVGNPNLADVRVVMIGVRNPARRTNPGDDGMEKCVEVWANELRLTDFDQSGGEAAMGRVSANLADFANVTVSGSISTPGWGSLESRVSERQRETIKTFDASAQVQLDKFLPDEVGLKVPMFVGYSQNVSNPQFAPEEPDTPMEIYLEDREPEERDSLKKISQTFTERKSINFTNVRKEKTGEGKARFYDVANLSATYAYTETNYRDFNTEYDFTKNYRGGLAYSFNNSPKSYEPFKKVKFIRKSKYLRLLRDFNFSLAPKTVAFSNDLDRMYSERKIRNINPEATVSQPPFVDKRFSWNRVYNLSYDITKALKLDFSANNRSLIREFEGERVNRRDDVGGFVELENGEIRESYDLHRDSVLSSIRNLGLTTNYNQTTSLTYSVPINKLPFMDWTNVSTRYSATYDWTRGPLPEPDLPDTIGHTISNGQQVQVNATLNMVSLYNKVPWLRDINRGRSRPSIRKQQKPKKSDDSKEVSVEKEEEKEKEKRENKGLKSLAKVLMSVKNISGGYTRNRGIVLPGYERETQFLGMSDGFVAPGFGFVFGQQENFGDSNTHFADWAGNEKRWLVANPNLFNPYTRSFSENLNFRASVQPVRDFRIDLTANESRTKNFTEYWNFSDSLTDELRRPTWTGNNTLLETGNYSVSIISFATTFQGVDTGNTQIYNEFLNNRLEVSRRIGEEKGISTKDEFGYTKGYGQAHQDVLIPAFFAAYTGGDVRTTPLDALKRFPLPNWRVNYTGLSKIPFFKKYFRSFSINHAYRSTYTVGSYIRSSTNVTDSFSLGDQIQPEFIITNVTVSEQFSPLINFDMTWLNSLLTRFEIKRDKNISLNTSNQQVTEVGNTEYVIGTGYTVKQVPFPFQITPGKTIKSDMTLRADFSIRQSTTVIRKIVQDEVQPTAGQTVYSLKVTGDYVLSKSLTLRLFYDWVSNRPVISNSFPTSNTNAGFSLRFTLSG